MALGVAARPPLSADERERLEFTSVTNFASNAEGEVALIIRRSENDDARSGLLPSPEGVVTRPI